MNLLEVRSTINENISDLTYRSSYQSGNDKTPYAVSGLQKLRSALNGLKTIPFIQAELDTLKSSWLYATYTDEAQVSSTDNSLVSSLISKIKIGLEFLLRTMEISEYAHLPETLYIKLPETKTFDELAKVSNDLKKGIDLPIHDENVQGEINILSAESGSIWLIVSVGTTAAVNLIAAICWSAAVIRKKNAEARIFELHAKTLELKNDAIDTFVDAQKKQINNILSNEAESIANNNYSRNDPENVERLKLSISTIADLIERGTQILPASKEPDVIKSFPDYNNLALIESSIKQLMGHKDS